MTPEELQDLSPGQRSRLLSDVEYALKRLRQIADHRHYAGLMSSASRQGLEDVLAVLEEEYDL